MIMRLLLFSYLFLLVMDILCGNLSSANEAGLIFGFPVGSWHLFSSMISFLPMIPSFVRTIVM